MSIRNPPCRVAGETRAGAASTFQDHIPAAGMRRAAGHRAVPNPQRISGCPSVDPDFGYGVVVLHQGCADIDGAFFLARKFETEPPASDRRVRLGDDV